MNQINVAKRNKQILKDYVTEFEKHEYVKKTHLHQKLAKKYRMSIANIRYILYNSNIIYSINNT